MNASRRIDLARTAVAFWAMLLVVSPLLAASHRHTPTHSGPDICLTCAATQVPGAFAAACDVQPEPGGTDTIVVAIGARAQRSTPRSADATRAPPADLAA